MSTSSAAHHGSTNIPSARLAGRNALSKNVRATTTSRTAKTEFVNYIALDTFRRETVLKEEEAKRTWKTKYDPWLTDAYQELYENISHTRGIPLDNHVISLKRPEWQQPADISPPIRIRLPGQRRRRVLGSFPQTENDKIGWRLLPEHAIDIYGSKLANIPPLPKQYKLSSWPVESFS